MSHRTLALAVLLMAAPATAQPLCDAEQEAMGLCPQEPPARPMDPPVAPPPPEALAGPDFAADSIWGADAMEKARANRLFREHGSQPGRMVRIDRLESRWRDGHASYDWDGEAWFGGDTDRLWLKSEGDGAFSGKLDSAEMQALYSRAINPWFNLQGGARYDIRPSPDRGYLVLGVQGLAPYWFEVDAAAFLSTKGDLSARIEAEYDQRLSNRLILQPRLALDFAGQDVPEHRIGSGLSSIEAGLRLRYAFTREFAPYLGVQYESRIGRSADFARAAGEDPDGWSLLLGLRFWF